MRRTISGSIKAGSSGCRHFEWEVEGGQNDWNAINVLKMRSRRSMYKLRSAYSGKEFLGPQRSVRPRRTAMRASAMPRECQAFLGFDPVASLAKTTIQLAKVSGANSFHPISLVH